MNTKDKYRTCDYCKNKFSRLPKEDASRRNKNSVKSYCSLKCKGLDNRNRKNIPCKNCNKMTERVISHIETNTFCSKSCSAKYNNTHKTHGTRRSKLERWLEEKLKNKYPNFEIHFNRKDAINSELDIYIPKLKLAFELNGIYHYEPIYGPEKLASIKNNDQRKFQACLENKIELCIIDTSGFDYFKEDKAKKFLNIIEACIVNKLTIN